MEQTADTGADLNDLLGGVDGTVVNVKSHGDPAFIKRGSDGFNKGVHVFGREELAMTTNPRGIINEGNELCLHWRAVDGDKGAKERVSLPHFISAGLGKGQPDFVGRLGVGLEQFILPDQPVEGGAGDLRTQKQSLFNAKPVKQRAPGNTAMRLGKHGLNGLQNVLGPDLAGFAFVGTRLVFHDRDTVFFIAAEPGLDGAPGELARVALLVGEGHLADRLDARPHGFTFSHVNGP